MGTSERAIGESQGRHNHEDENYTADTRPDIVTEVTVIPVKQYQTY